MCCQADSYCISNGSQLGKVDDNFLSLTACTTPSSTMEASQYKACMVVRNEHRALGGDERGLKEEKIEHRVKDE